MTFRKHLLVIIASLTLSAGASARTWMTVTGQHFEPEFVRVEGANGIFIVKGKDYLFVECSPPIESTLQPSPRQETRPTSLRQIFGRLSQTAD